METAGEMGIIGNSCWEKQRQGLFHAIVRGFLEITDLVARYSSRH